MSVLVEGSDVLLFRPLTEPAVVQIDLDALISHMAATGVVTSEQELVASLDNFGFDLRTDGLWECEEGCLSVLAPFAFRRVGRSD